MSAAEAEDRGGSVRWCGEKEAHAPHAGCDGYTVPLPMRIGHEVTYDERITEVKLGAADAETEDRGGVVRPELDLDELERLRAEGTPGEWRLVTERSDPEGAYPVGIQASAGVWPVRFTDDTGTNQWADGLLIARAVNALPALIAAARERDRLREALTELLAAAAHTESLEGRSTAALCAAVDTARATLDVKP